MEQQIPSQYLDLFEKRSFGNLATMMPDGTLQVTPVWVDFDGMHILVNTVQGRQKEINMEQRKQVGMDILDPNNPYRYISIRGHVAEITATGADENIDKLAKKYLGQEKYPWRQPDEVRVICKIAPDRVIAQG